MSGLSSPEIDDITSQVDHGKSVSRTLILCMSSAALNSDWVSSELNTIIYGDPMNRECRFIPLLLEDCVSPDTLRRFKYIDYRHKNEAGFQELVNICHPNSSGNFDPELIIEDDDNNHVVEVSAKNVTKKTKTDVLQALYQAHKKASEEWVKSDHIREKLELTQEQMDDYILGLREQEFIETKFLDKRALLKITTDGVAIVKLSETSAPLPTGEKNEPESTDIKKYPEFSWNLLESNNFKHLPAVRRHDVVATITKTLEDTDDKQLIFLYERQPRVEKGIVLKGLQMS